MYSLKQAAQAVGRGKPAILRAIQNGIISATRNAKNEWLIDPAELHRVYPPISSTNQQGNDIELNATQIAIETTQRENLLLREQIKREQEINKALSNRLEQADKERRETLEKLTVFLTYQREEKPKKRWWQAGN